MVKKLQHKFIAIATGSVFIMLLMVLGLINIISSVRNNIETGQLLTYIAENNGYIPSINSHTEARSDLDTVLTPETQFETRYFSVWIDDGKVTDINLEHIAAVSLDDAARGAMHVMKSGQDRGRARWNGRSYDYLVDDRGEEGTLVVVLDTSKLYYGTVTLVRFSAYVGIVMIGIFFLLISALSRRVLRPVINNIESQKQFITNASHELKTPLAIISANTEVLEMTDGDSEWIRSIRNQVERLTGLINSLIALAKLQEWGEIQLTEVPASAIVKEVAESFKTVLEQMGKEYKYEVESDIYVLADERGFHELVSILLDNAAKYCDDKGSVELTLERRGKACALSVSNTYAEGANVDYSRFFDRFYREDQSHNSEKKGYGIGLSMASEMVTQFKGKMTVSYKDGRILFTVTI